MASPEDLKAWIGAHKMLSGFIAWVIVVAFMLRWNYLNTYASDEEPYGR